MRLLVPFLMLFSLTVNAADSVGMSVVTEDATVYASPDARQCYQDRDDLYERIRSLYPKAWEANEQNEWWAGFDRQRQAMTTLDWLPAICSEKYCEKSIKAAVNGTQSSHNLVQAEQNVKIARLESKISELSQRLSQYEKP